MKTTTIAPFGGPVDVCWHRGRVVTAWQSGAGTDVRLVVAEIDPVSHVILLSYSIALGDDVGAFPRLLSALGSWWLIYREGKSLGGRAVLRRDGIEVWRSPWECGGNDCVCFGEMSGRPAFAAQQSGAENLVFGGTLDKPHETVHRIGLGAADGLHAFNGAAGVTLIKDVRGAVPGMTRPTWALGLAAGEHPDAGVLVRDIDDGRELLLWAGQAGATPRITYDHATGTFAVVTWGVLRGIDYGVRLATFTESDLTTQAPQPSETWDAPGTVVDCVRFFDIIGSTVPREAADGQCWQAHRVESRDEVYIVKGADPRFVEILRLTDDDVRLAYDATDGRYPLAWRLDVVGDGRSDASWCRTHASVGSRAGYPAARLIRRTEVGASTTEPFPYAVGLEAHGRHIDYGGDVGVVDAVLVTRFEPHVGQTADGYHELHAWAVKSGRAIGLVRYEEIRSGKVARAFTFNRAAPDRSVPLSSLIVHPIPDPPVVPDETKPPMPTLIPRDRFADAFRQVNDFYAAADGLKRPGGMVIDVDGVPTADVQALIQWGYDLAAGMPVPLVLSRIRQSEEWRAKHPSTEPPPPDPDPLPDPGQSQVLPVVVDGRILRTTDGAALDWREASFFMVLARWLGQNGGSPAQMVEAFRAWRGKRINTLRGFVSIGHPNFWQSRGWLLTPRTPGIYKALHDCTVAAAAEGIRMRWTLLADTGDVFRDGADVRAHVVACMDALRGLPCVIEICNEPTMNGYGSGWAQELADLGRSLDESAVIALGPEHGATGHLATADIPPADVVFFHAERVLNEGGWAWVRRLGEYGVVKDGRRPVISGEPVNAGDEGAPGDYLRDPAVWFAYGAISRLVVSHGYAPTFHYHDGLFAEMPNEATDRCLQAFIAGCDAVPLDVRSWAWTNGHHAEAPWRGYDQTDPPSDNRPSRIYGRRSGGTYWGVSLREPKGWSWPDLRYPVERVARAEGERFDCSVWRGRP